MPSEPHSEQGGHDRVTRQSTLNTGIGGNRGTGSMNHGFTPTDDPISHFLDVRSGRQLTQSSIDTYTSMLREFERFLADRDKRVMTAEFPDVLDYLDQCVDRGNRESTLRGKLTGVSELYIFIKLRTEKGDRLNIDPLELETIDLSKYNTPEDIEREPLTREEIRRLFDAMDSYRNRLMVLVAVETGVRNSDLRDLRVQDVDVPGKKIYVRDSKFSRSYEVPISSGLSVELEIWVTQYRPPYLHNKESDYLFPSQHGGKIETNGRLNDIVKSAADAAGIQETIAVSELSPEQKRRLKTDKDVRRWHRVTPHTLRHTCLTLMQNDGVPLQYRQLVANHRNPRTTQGYSHGSEQEFNEIRKQFDPPR